MKFIDATDRLYRAHSVKTVYVIRMGDTNFYKIGFTAKDNFYRRIGELQVGNPLRLKVVLEIISERAESIEKDLHWEFTDKRQRGEWFALEDADLQQLEASIKSWVEIYCHNGSRYQGMSKFLSIRETLSG